MSCVGMTTSGGWDFFDAIFCINLEKDIQKRREAQRVFDDFSIPAKFFKSVRDEIPNKGCLESHKSIYNLSLEEGYDKILIFEDDVVPASEITASRLKKCTDFMRGRPWDIFYFGAVPSILNYSQEKTPVKNVYKIRGICTHAYALNRSALQKLRDVEWKPGAPLDYLIRDDDALEKYAVYPSFFNQKTGYKLPGGVIALGLRANEAYAYYIGVPLKYALIALFILAAVLVLRRALRNKRSGLKV